MKKITFKTPISSGDDIEKRTLNGYSAGSYRGFHLIVNRSPRLSRSWQVCEYTTGRTITPNTIYNTRNDALQAAYTIIDTIEPEQLERAQQLMRESAINEAPVVA